MPTWREIIDQYGRELDAERAARPNRSGWWGIALVVVVAAVLVLMVIAAL